MLTGAANQSGRPNLKVLGFWSNRVYEPCFQSALGT
uniref:Uncharacterized protein n=1 Tax=Utricularia reniformis TaxID=192314 RepID=A0A1Y0AZE8_9LAMI|nr:hypothetical protein AEK19_MT0235 [Utricularia reniformis]ART30513.1 hypothetical protein AEK19_MT0235 [Utricularia reniformis]